VNRLTLDFPELPDLKVTNATFEKLVFDRKTERYKEAILISKMLLLNYRPDITGGAENVIAILFDMNKLWEEFVYRKLKKEETTFAVTVHRQQSEAFWNSKLLYRPKTIRPDIVIKKGSQTTIVDTKWKLVDDLMPGDDDLKQMYIYNLFWECNRSILLYPSSMKDFNHGDYYDYRNKGKLYTKCSIQTVSILDEAKKNLNKNFGGNVLDEILK
jgi:5-methylcytosine-specific restriction enzyme subunit McrC